MSDLDPTHTDPDKYKVVFENDQVRVLEYCDTPGAKTKPHQHPNPVLLFLSNFRRRLTVGNEVRDVTVEAGQAVWSPAAFMYLSGFREVPNGLRGRRLHGCEA
jgi:beta-alanine degradation protein BauB